MASDPDRFSSAVNRYLPYVSLQPDYTQVFSGVAEGLQSADRAWLSVYALNAPHASIHAKLTLAAGAGNGAVDVQVDEAFARQLALHRDADSARDLRVNTTAQQSTRSANGPTLSNIVLPRILLRTPRREVASDVGGPLGITAFDVSPTDNCLYVAAGADGKAYVGHLDGTSDDGDFDGEDDDDSIEARAQRRIRLRTREAQMAKKTPLKGHVGDVRSARFFPSGEVILTTSSDCTTKVFGIDGVNPRTLTGHRRAVLDSAFIDKGKQVLTASLDGTTRLWDIAQDVQMASLTSHQCSGVRALALLDGGHGGAGGSDACAGSDANALVIMGLSSGTLEGFDLQSRKVAFRLPRAYFPSGDAPLASDNWEQTWSGGVDSVAWSAERRAILVGTDNGVTMLHDVRMLSSSLTTAESVASPRETPASLLMRWRRNGAAVNDVQFAAQGNEALVATADGTPYRVDLSTSAPRVVEEYTGWEIDNVAACRIDARSRVWLAGAGGRVSMY